MTETLSPYEAEARKFNDEQRKRRQAEAQQSEKELVILFPGGVAEVLNREMQGATQLSELVDKIRSSAMLDEIQEGVGPINDLANEVESLADTADPVAALEEVSARFPNVNIREAAIKPVRALLRERREKGGRATA